MELSSAEPFPEAPRALTPTGASAFGSPELTCARSWDLVQSLLKRHISFRGLDSELRERAIDAYIERIDPSKTLYLSSEIKQLRGELQDLLANWRSEPQPLDSVICPNLRV